MAEIGLFTRQELKAGAETRRSSAPADMTAQRLNELGLVGVKNMNPAARSKNMRPSGSETPTIYVLGEAPGETEDEEGEPFVGKSGRLLRQAIGRDNIDLCRFNNVVRTRPPKNRPPEFHEIECYRPSIEEDIEATKPKIILGCGNVPLSWMLDDMDGIVACRGRCFPVRVRSHECFFYPVLHPAHILRMDGGEKTEEDIPAEQWKSCFMRDVKRAVTQAQEDREPYFLLPKDLLPAVTCLEGRSGDLSIVERFLEEAAKVTSGVDIETNCLRPYAAKKKMLSISVATQQRAVAFAWDHPQARWLPHERTKLATLLRHYLIHSRRKVAHNASFEMEWFLNELGEDVIWGNWDCSMVQAYHLDCRTSGKDLDARTSGLSLDYLTTLRFGTKLKDFSTTMGSGLFGDRVKIDRARLEFTKLGDVLQYNGLDALYCLHLSAIQRAELKERGMLEAHRFHLKRLPGVVLAEAGGVNVDQTRVKQFQISLTQEIKDIVAEIKALPEVKEYEQLLGVYNPTAPKDLTQMLRDILKLKDGETRDGGYSTNKKILEKIKHVKIVELTQKLRTLVKLKSSYVDSLDPLHKKTIVYPDGKIHTSFNTTKTVSRRLSSDDPNMQNFPKRKNAEIRSCIVAAADSILLACDYGALEACGIAMDSRDKNLVKHLWNKYDIHMSWGKRVVEVFDKTFIARGSDWKAWRSDIKNQLVFPAFYLAQIPSIARSLGMQEKLVEVIFKEFWSMFAGVKAWQNEKVNFYNENFYTESLTGFRRYGPMSESMIVNTPIQGMGSDIVCDAWQRLARKSYEERKPWLAPCLNVHDDLTFHVPLVKVEDAVPIIVNEMTSTSFAFVNVPLVVEMSAGRNWHEMHEVGKFSSNSVEEDLVKMKRQW